MEDTHNKNKIIIETSRCILRELTLDDMQELFDLYYEPHITDYIEPLYPWEEEMVYQRAYMKQVYEVYGYGMWAVINKADGRLIGRAGIESRENCNPKEVEMGYVITPKLQRQGYATEVCQSIMEYTREHLPGYTIICNADEENVASIGLLHKLGFTKMSDVAKCIYKCTLKTPKND